MKKLLLAVLATACVSDAASTPIGSDVARWEQQARNVTIVRDDWGIAHVYGKTDADAIFGLIYAQAEDDFNRVETNYINAIGRLAEAEGESEIYRDLRMKLFIDPDTLKKLYASSPGWLKTNMNAWADGLNFYLFKHPEVKPRVITKFEPWMPLAFSEGSIGGDIERVNLHDLQAFYDKQNGGSARPSTVPAEQDAKPKEPSGSNGIAIAPANTENKRALLLINPHTSFFFRSEAQAVSEEGLNVYGASTWGQFFVYQGFNDRLGWMHTSSGVDVVDEYAESIVKKGDSLFYRYGDELGPVIVSKIKVPYKTASGMATREFTVYSTTHGPIVREAGSKWIAIRLMNKPVEALSQSYLRTKARNYDEFRKVMDLRANSSNNTIYADADGNIAYFHPQFIPRRNPEIDWTKPVNGADTSTEWHGLHSVDDSPFLKNPPNGWIFNTNNWPYSAAGQYSPKMKDFPRYMDMNGENPRGLHAIRVLEGRTDFTLQKLLDAAFDSYLTAFAQLVPPLIDAYDRTNDSDPTKQKVAEQIAMLRAWDYRWSATSIPTSLAVYWGEELSRRTRRDAETEMMSVYDYMARRTSASQKLGALAAASDRLTTDFGTWKTPWGAINRYQRNDSSIVQTFDDSKPSIPVPFTSAIWGSLASFGARTYPGTKKMYGTSGNSFVAAVEFGKDSVRARAVTAGGESGHPSSKHFGDQAERYASGNLRPVYFYRGQLKGHTEREYKPGQ